MPTPLVIEAFYWLSHCSTCQKAEAFLKERGAKIQRYIDVKTESVSRTELEQLVQKIGSVEALFSKRAMKYRQWGLDKQTLSPDEMLDYMAKEYTFIKRPVLVTKDGQILSGFSAKQYGGLFG